jgi:hydrogenase-4 component B
VRGVTLGLILVAIGLLASSGAVSLIAKRGTRAGDALFALLMGSGGVLGFVVTLSALVDRVEIDASFVWEFPLNRIAFHLDALAACFLLPVFLVTALGAIYAFEYWSEADHPRSARRLRVFYGWLSASMALVVLAHDGLLFLFAWEAMALSAFFAITAEDDSPEVRRAGWIYFVATHVGTLALIALFAVLRSVSGTFELVPLAAGPLTPALATSLFVLALVGFGLKAGLMPLHVWLPGAHANSPSHVSAVLSGVLLKIGIYGVVRVASLLPTIAVWWAWLLIGIGSASAVLGIAYAVTQRDYKRLLAYSSIENIGIIGLGLGVALLGRATGDALLTGLALAGTILHVWNHALFKPLLFFVAGSVLHATGTRDLAMLGGLQRRMPRTAILALAGCVAIAALPPFNGFVSEWLIYRGFLRGVSSGSGVLAVGTAAAAAALATTGALAAATFAKLFGTAFLGQARSDATERAHDPHAAMLVPMLVLGLTCLAIGVLPFAVVPLLAPVVASAGAIPIADVERFQLGQGLNTMSMIAVGLLASAVVASLWLQRRARSGALERPGTWDCGFVQPSSRMQYGPSSLAQMFLGLFGWALRPRTDTRPIVGAFPAPSSQTAEVPDVVLDRILLPSLDGLARLALRLRLLQQGKIQVYVLYVLIALLALLLVT